MALNTALVNAAELLARDINAGAAGARQSLGGGGTAFGWASGSGMPRTIANYVTVSTSDGMSFPVVRVTKSGTPAAKVAPGAQKPTAGVLAESTVTLQKHAGMMEANLESFMNAQGLAGAIASVLGASCLQSFEADAIATLDTATGATAVTGADWVAAIAAGQAAVLAAGGSPGLLVISAANYGDFLADVSASAGFAVNPESPVGSVFGSLVHVSSGATAGKAFVLDPAAVVAVQHINSPIVVLDTASQAHVNKIRIVTDLLAASFVVNAQLVAEVTAPA